MAEGLPMKGEVRFRIVRHVDGDLVPVIEFDRVEEFAAMSPKQFASLGGFLRFMSLVVADAKKGKARPS